MEIEVQCPHCQGYVVIALAELNCCIFRHAVYADSYHQIPPHASEAECQALLAQNLVLGCAKPFQVVRAENGDYSAVACDYI
jgi:hypothetical protein